MKIVIQCSGTKNGGLWSVSEFNEIEMTFVAHPNQYNESNSANPFKPDDLVPDTPKSWRNYLVAYNQTGENPDGLLRAGELYKPEIYSRLVGKYGWQNTYILSAGWGLVRSDFLLPYYDITFSPAAESYKRRRKTDRFDDFNHLLDDQSVLDGETILFFGGTSYLPLYHSLTRDIGARKIIFHTAETISEEMGFEYIRYRIKRRTNWHYSCAEDFMAGRIGI